MTRRMALLAALLTITAFALAPTAHAYPPGTAPTAAVSTSAVTNCSGASLVLSGANFAPNTTATVSVASQATVLGTAQVDANGATAVTIATDQIAAGAHTLTITDGSESASANFTVTDCAPSSGPTFTTGVAIASIGGAGLSLLLVGFFLMWLGKRRDRIES